MVDYYYAFGIPTIYVLYVIIEKSINKYSLLKNKLNKVEQFLNNNFYPPKNYYESNNILNEKSVIHINNKYHMVNPMDIIPKRTNNTFDINDCDIYYINLEKSKKRKEFIEKQLNKFNFSYKRFNAIDAKCTNFNLNDYNYKINKDLMNYFNKDNKKHIGHLGCLLSHFMIYQTFLNNSKAKYLMVFEDDVIFVDNFKETLIKRTEFIPNDWDLILLGSHHYHTLSNNFNKEIFNGVYELNHKFYGTYGYILNKNSVKKILTYITHGFDLIDGMLGDITKQEHIKTYSLIHPLVYPTHNSTITTNTFQYYYETNITDSNLMLSTTGHKDFY